MHLFRMRPTISPDLFHDKRGFPTELISFPKVSIFLRGAGFWGFGVLGKIGFPTDLWGLLLFVFGLVCTSYGLVASSKSFSRYATSRGKPGA